MKQSNDPSEHDEINDLVLRAERGDADSQNEFAARVATGDGVEKSIESALRWYNQAARQESPEALYNFALMNLLGEGLPKNRKKAVDMLEESADLSSPDACIVLAEAYEDRNLGFEENYITSAGYYLRAFRFGSTKAIHRLGEQMANQKISMIELTKLMRHFPL